MRVLYVRGISCVVLIHASREGEGGIKSLCVLTAARILKLRSHATDASRCDKRLDSTPLKVIKCCRDPEKYNLQIYLRDRTINHVLCRIALINKLDFIYKNEEA